MRRICTGILAAALALSLFAAGTAQAKVYKMDPEERAAALKEKKTKRSKAKKSGKAYSDPGKDQGGWVEVKPGEKVAKRSKKNKVDEVADAAEKKGRKHKKKADAAEAAPEKKSKAKKAEAEPKVEKKSARKADKKADRPAERQAEKKSGKKGRKSASRGDRAVGSGYGGERKVSASSTEVRRPADDLSAYSVSRPGQDKAAPAASAPAASPAPAVVPEVRQEVQPGPLDNAKPVGTEQKSGDGRF